LQTLESTTFESQERSLIRMPAGMPPLPKGMPTLPK